jgi:FixJ family two-component response regulator
MPPNPFVAIVDDDESIRVTTQDLLESAGFRAAAFPSAEAFLDSALLPGIDCAIADMRMPGMSGLALHGHLVASGRPVPMLLMTAYPDESVRARALQAGVVAYLVKPFTDHELLGCIKAALRQDTRSV